MVHHLTQKIGFKGTRRVACGFHGFFRNPPLSAMKITPCKNAEKPSLPPAKHVPTEPLVFQHLGGLFIPPIQEDLKSEISSWLEALHKDRAWLAEQCQVTPKTVDRWLMFYTTIPATRENRIRELMKKHPAPRQ
ncbi:MAG: hypothetical protein Q4C88_04205 [Akkermansia sp.]|nr:hypothetical protein [Akkermansia sp.]